jgi:hypothetical protein
MSRSLRLGNHRFLLAGVAALLLGLSCGAATASAATIETNCKELRKTISFVAEKPSDGEGYVIVLNGVCESENLGSTVDGVTIPSGSNFSIEGAPGTTSGFDGTNIDESPLRSTGTVGTMTLANLVFEHSRANAALVIDARQLTLSGDTFLENVQPGSSSDGGGAAFITAGDATPSSCGSEVGPVDLRIVGSSFRGNKMALSNQVGRGGAIEIIQDCPTAQAVLEGNTFEGNAIESSASTEAFGGAVYFSASGAGQPASLVQRGNVFDSNRITVTSGTGNFGGGGEWVEGTSLTSVGDRFSRNDLAGATGSEHFSRGGGLGILDTECNSVTPTASTVQDAVVAGNSIGDASEGGQSEGAGIFASCRPPQPNAHFQLALNDSTVAGNQAPGGIAGVDGEEADQLELSNSIVTSPSAQADIGGFRVASGGSLTSSFSDACEPGTSTALPGQGNICADPLLAGAETGDVHETSASPTIDAGANALVPGGLSTDAFGGTRIVPGHVGCTGSFPAVVDMGAAEFQPAAPLCPPPILKTVLPRPPGLTHFVRLKTTAKGAALTLSCTSTDGLGCSGTIFITTDELLHGKKIVAISLEGHTKKSVRIAQTPFAIPAGGTATIQVKLNATGLKLLRRFHAFSTFLIANEASPTSDPFIFLFHTARFSEPKKKPKKHHPRRPKHAKHH